MASVSELLDELRELARGGGYADSGVLRRVKELLFALEHTGSVRVIGMEAAGIRDAFEKLYSARKHARYPDGVLQQQVLRHCQSISRILAPSSSQ